MLFAETTALENILLTLLEIVKILGPIAATLVAYLVKVRMDEVKVKVDAAEPVQKALVEEVKIISTDLAETKVHINGMKGELIEAVKGRYQAEGEIAGALKEQDRLAEKNVEKVTNGLNEVKEAVADKFTPIQEVVNDTNDRVRKIEDPSKEK